MLLKCFKDYTTYREKPEATILDTSAEKMEIMYVTSSKENRKQRYTDNCNDQNDSKIVRTLGLSR